MPGRGDNTNQIDGGSHSSVVQARDIGVVNVKVAGRAPVALSGLPAASRAFTGRESELRALLRPLSPDHGVNGSPSGSPAPSVAAVGGMAGVGKTELVLQAAHAAWARGWFPGGVLFIDLFGYDPDRRLDPGQALGELLWSLGVAGEYIPAGTQARARLYASTARRLSAMATELGDEQTRLGELTYADLAVQTAFDLSVRHVDPEHARLFRLLSLNAGPDISTHAAVALTGADETMTRRRLRRLARAHLVERGTTEGRWRMHDLVRLYADQRGRALAEEDGRAPALSRLLHHYLALAREADDHLDDREASAASSRFAGRRAAEEWLDAEYTNLTAACVAARNSHPEVARDLPHAMGGYLQRRRHLNHWITLSAIARDAARRLGDRRGEATALNSFAIALIEAEVSRGRMLHMQRSTPTLDDGGHSEAETLKDLGVSTVERRRFEGAVIALQTAARLFGEVNDRHSEGRTLHNLAVCLTQAGRAGEAVTVHEEAAKIFRLTGDRHGESATVTGQKMARDAQGSS